VAHACENVGFFYAFNHGVPEVLIDRAVAAARRFHALPLAEKLALKLNENNIGYLPINASVQGASTVHKATKPNQNESFFVSHDRGADHPDVLAGKPLRGRNQWPAGLPEIRADMMAYFDALGAMCDRMLPPLPWRSASTAISLHRSSPMRRTPICAFCTNLHRIGSKTTALARRRTLTTAS